MKLFKASVRYHTSGSGRRWQKWSGTVSAQSEGAARPLALQAAAKHAHPARIMQWDTKLSEIKRRVGDGPA